MTRLPAIIVTLALTLWAGAILRDAADDWVDQTQLPNLLVDTSTEIRDRNGALLRVYTVADGRWRLPVSVESVDPGYLQMLMAYEDKRFRDHAGVDPIAMTRAAWQSLWAGRIVSGGSTLTMQVARLLENSGTGRWQGKIRQARLALALERQLSKDEILNLYLQLSPMGGNLEGLRAATLSYFGKEPRRLTPAEAAMLVALPQSPEARRPDRDPLAAQRARDRVILRMQGAGIITADAAAAAMGDTGARRRIAFPALAPHMTDRAYALARARALAPDRPSLALTLDAGLQRGLQDLAAKTLQSKSDRLSIAILVADHRSGEILASVGSAGVGGIGQADTRQGHVDMTQALRSPGSTLKPLIYGLAFDAGLAHPETVIDDRPMEFDGYAPLNFDGVFRGEIRVAEALRLSLNLPAVQLTQAIGPENLMSGLRRAGTNPVVPGGKPGLAVSLGGVGMTLTDLVQLYAGLANAGTSQQLRWIKSGWQDHGTAPDTVATAKIANIDIGGTSTGGTSTGGATIGGANPYSANPYSANTHGANTRDTKDDRVFSGTTITPTPRGAPQKSDHAQRILSRASAWQVGHILAGLAPPAGAPANRLAYKTGTSYGHRDAWAIGYDGQHVIGVWLGRPDGTPVPGAFGGDLAAPVLFEAFGRLKSELAAPPPPPPETLLVAAAQLPEPLRRFRSRDAYSVPKDAPKLAFPPDGAILAQAATLPVRVRDGRPPFTWLANGRPLATALRDRDTVLPDPGRGFTDLTVIDAGGRSASVRVRID